MFEFEASPDFPAVIDNTMRSTFVSCPRKFWYQHLQNLNPGAVNPDLYAGACFARGIEVTRREYYGSHKSPDLAIVAGIRAFILEWGIEYDPDEAQTQKTFIATLGALVAYFDEYPLERDTIKPLLDAAGNPAVEFSFSLPLPGCFHPVTGDPILWTGRFDMLGERDGMIVGVDEKTTKQLGPTWASRWDLRSQFTGYTWGAREFGYDVSAFIVRGISILKHDYGHAQVITYRSQWEIDRWLAQVTRDVNRMIQCWEEGYFDYDLNDSCTAYRGCAFRELCLRPEPERWVDGYFTFRHWDPTATDKSNSGIIGSVGDYVKLIEGDY